jgi:hypothetical protein
MNESKPEMGNNVIQKVLEGTSRVHQIQKFRKHQMLLGKMLKQFSLLTVTLGHIKSQHVIDSVGQTVNNAVRRRFKGIVNTGNNNNPSTTTTYFTTYAVGETPITTNTRNTNTSSSIFGL